MKSEWKVTSNYIGDKKQYAVYRTLDTTMTDHSGNREFATGYMDSREEAAVIANIMNEGEGQKCSKCSKCGKVWQVSSLQKISESRYVCPHCQDRRNHARNVKASTSS